MKKNFKLVIQYDGGRYLGWQRQNSQPDKTIQGKIESALSKMMESNIEIIGSGRTDTGVHARAQVAHFYADTEAKPQEIQDYLNQYLPDDIGIIAVTQEGERFHARYNVNKKTYLYRIHLGSIPNVFERKFVYSLNRELDIIAMRKAAKLMIGEHDFKAFSTKSIKRSSVKTIYEIKIEETEDGLNIFVTGSGFLYNMVRIIVGTLIEVGQRDKSPYDVEKILQSKDRTLAGYTVPPQGLILYEVEYKELEEQSSDDVGERDTEE